MLAAQSASFFFSSQPGPYRREALARPMVAPRHMAGAPQVIGVK